MSDMTDAPHYGVTGTVKITLSIRVDEYLEADDEQQAATEAVSLLRSRLDDMKGPLGPLGRHVSDVEWGGPDDPDVYFDEDPFKAYLLERFLEYLREVGPGQLIRTNLSDGKRYIDQGLNEYWVNFFDGEVEDGQVHKKARDYGVPDELEEVTHPFWRDYL